MPETSTALSQVEESKSIAEMFAKSGLFPDIANVKLDIAIAQAQVKILAGRELGLQPLYSMMNIAIIKGRLFYSSALCGAVLKNSEKYRYDILEHDEQHCVLDFLELRDGKWVKVYQSSYTMEEAQKAGALRPMPSGEPSNYVKHPKDMMLARARARGVRAVGPEQFGRIYVIEEAEEVVGGWQESKGEIPEDVSAPAAALSEGQVPGDAGQPTEEAQSTGEEIPGEETEPESQMATPSKPEAFTPVLRKEEPGSITPAQAASINEELRRDPSPIRQIMFAWGRLDSLWRQISKPSQMSEYQAAIVIHQLAGNDGQDIVKEQEEAKRNTAPAEEPKPRRRRKPAG